MGSAWLLHSARRFDPVPGIEGHKAEDGEGCRYRCAGFRDYWCPLLHCCHRAWRCRRTDVLILEKWLYKWLPIFFGCHCRADRSFSYKGKPFPICARCTGELIGILFSLLSCFFFRAPAAVCGALLLPLVVDGVVQLKTPYESNNIMRLITGCLFGYGLCQLFLITSIGAFRFGYRLTAN